MTNTHEDLTRAEEVKGSSDRSFGFVFTAVFLVIGCAPLVRGNPVRFWALAISGLFLIASLFHPALMSPLNRVWFRFGKLLHRVVSPVVLGVMFYLILTPAGLLLRLMGKNLLQLRRVAAVETYWIKRDPSGPAPESMANQF